MDTCITNHLRDNLSVQTIEVKHQRTVEYIKAELSRMAQKEWRGGGKEQN